jgi:hypothetical protein
MNFFSKSGLIILIFFIRQLTQKIQLWGEHGETFDEKTVIEKSKQGIVMTVLSGFTSGSFKGL